MWILLLLGSLLIYIYGWTYLWMDMGSIHKIFVLNISLVCLRRSRTQESLVDREMLEVEVVAHTSSWSPFPQERNGNDKFSIITHMYFSLMQIIIQLYS